MLLTKDGVIKRSVQILLENIDKRFEITEIMICAALLDPSVQHLAAIDDWVAKKKTTKAQILRNVITDLEIDIENEIELNVGHRQPVVVVNSQVQQENDPRIALLKKHAAIMRRPNVELIESELKNFQNFNEEVADVLLFWKNYEHTYPTLAKIAKVILAKPATSAKSESSFSVAGALITSRRSSVHPLRAEKTLFIHDNYHLREMI